MSEDRRQSQRPNVAGRMRHRRRRRCRRGFRQKRRHQRPPETRRHCHQSRRPIVVGQRRCRWHRGCRHSCQHRQRRRPRQGMIRSSRQSRMSSVADRSQRRWRRGCGHGFQHRRRHRLLPEMSVSRRQSGRPSAPRFPLSHRDPDRAFHRCGGIAAEHGDIAGGVVLCVIRETAGPGRTRARSRRMTAVRTDAIFTFFLSAVRSTADGYTERRARGLANSSRPEAIRKRATKTMTMMMTGGRNHHQSPCRRAA